MDDDLCLEVFAWNQEQQPRRLGWRGDGKEPNVIQLKDSEQIDLKLRCYVLASKNDSSTFTKELYQYKQKTNKPLTLYQKIQKNKKDKICQDITFNMQNNNKKMGCLSSRQQRQKAQRQRNRHRLKTKLVDKDKKKRELHQYLDDIFTKYDLNKKNMLGKQEVYYMMMQMASLRRPTTTKKQLQKYVETFMRNVDGDLTRQQFHKKYIEI